MRTYIFLLLSTAALLLVGVNQSRAQEAELLKVLQSNSSLEQKSAACRELCRVATKEAVPTLAELLDDDKLSHMARYALEAIPDASVDEALRAALGRLQGTQRLGVIGSLGVRRDTQAVAALSQLLTETDEATAQAAARALGSIGSASAADALKNASATMTEQTRQAICEGLLRCAEALQEANDAEASRGIYDHLRGLADTPLQVRAAALRGAILIRGDDGIPMLIEALNGPDYGMAAAATRAAMELPGNAITDVLMNQLPNVPAERQGLVILALADREDTRVAPAVLKTAESAAGPLQMLALRALKRVGGADSFAPLLKIAVDGDGDVTQAAMEALESLQDSSLDAQLAKELLSAQGKSRLLLIDLARRRHTVAATQALWQAAEDDDIAVRAAALTSLGTLIDADALPKLIARLGNTASGQEATALDQAIRDLCRRSEDPQQAAGQLAAELPKSDASVQARILDTLKIIGGPTSLQAVANAAAQSDDESLRDEAFRVLGQWRSTDVAPVLLKLLQDVNDQRLKVRAIRAYIRIARQFDMPDDQRAEMCRTAMKLAQRDEDRALVLDIPLRYPSPQMQAIVEDAVEIPALKDKAQYVLMGMTSEGIDRAQLGRALAQAGRTPVDLEIVKAVYGAGDKTKDVTETLRKYAKNYRILFLPSASYNGSFGGDPAQGVVKQLKIQYRINGKAGSVTLGENALIVLPMPK
jgi:HEAT repeat protein